MLAGALRRRDGSRESVVTVTRTKVYRAARPTGGWKTRSIEYISGADVLVGGLVQVGSGTWAIIAGGLFTALVAIGLRGAGRRA